MFVLQKPALRGLVGVADDSNTSLGAIEKFKALVTNRQQMENILDQSYLLLMIGRTVELDPKLAADPMSQSICNAIESKINSLDEAKF